MTMHEYYLTVKYVYSPACRGSRNSLHVPEEPDEPEQIGIYEVVDDTGKQVELSEHSLERLEEHILGGITK